MDLVALSAVRAIPTRNGGRASDVGEAGDGREGAVSAADQPVVAVGAGDCGQRAAAHVVFGVVGDADSLAGCGGFGFHWGSLC